MIGNRVKNRSMATLNKLNQCGSRSQEKHSMADSYVSNTPSFWKNLAKDSDSCVKHVNKKMHFLFPPYYFENVKKSVKTIIDQKLNSFQDE